MLQRSREAILTLELLTKLNEGVDVDNMMEGTFDFKQFQVYYNLDLNHWMEDVVLLCSSL